MLKKLVAIFLSGLILVGVSGCSAADKDKIQSDNLMDKVSVSDDNVTGLEPDEAFQEATADFAVELLKHTDIENGNTLISPASIMFALGMTANGAKNDTLEAFEEVLGAGTDIELINQYYKKYADTILSSKEGAKLSVANSIWIRNMQNFEVNEDFLNNNAFYYKSAVYKAEFDSSTVEDVNKWVNDNTDGMIDKIIEKFNGNEVMMLINAIAFDAEWADAYEENQVRDIEFTKASGTTQTVKGMFSSEMTYLEDENTTGFIKAYKNGYSFVALLPEEGLSIEEYVNSLTGEKIQKLINGRENTEVKTMIPKFTYEYSISFKDGLSDMGLESAFESGADFSGMLTEDTNMDLCIADVVHKTYIEMAEKGTKAGAATAVIMEENDAIILEEYKEVYLNRPFVYMIIDDELNTPIFIGTVSEIVG